MFLFIALFVSKQSYSFEHNSGLIPREVLFAENDYSQAKLSPDGLYLSYLAINNGVPNIYISKIGSEGDFRPVTNYDKKCISKHAWTYDNKHIVYHYDDSGSENTQIYVVNIETGQIRNLTPFQAVKSEIDNISPNFPDRILAVTNKRDRKYFDVLEIQINSGESRVIYENKNGYSSLLFDDLYNLRFAHKISGNTFDIYRFDEELRPSLLLNSSIENYADTKIVAVPSSRETISMLDSHNVDIPHLIQLNLRTGKKTNLAKTNKGALSSFFVHPVSKEVQAVQVNYDKKKWQILDKDIKEDFKFLQSINSGVMQILSRTLQDDKWVVCFDNDNSSSVYYLYDRIQKKAKMLFKNKASLDKYKLSKMHPVEIKTRDGLTMIGYIKLPLINVKTEDDKRTSSPLPLILKIHGGPRSRDEWGFNAEHQFFANRGYAVLSINYRGSIGFGKKFLEAGNGEWGGKMHLDVIDAANWAVKNKIALKEKIAIYGASYGGYEALVGLTFTPDFFACGVDLVGISNLVTNVVNKPAYWQAILGVYYRSLGAEKGQDFLSSISPITYANRIKKPLLIAHGANDPRVKKAESDQMVEAMRQHHIPVTYILYQNEGHGISRSENRMSFYAIMELFFSKYLGGKAEPLSDEIEKSSVVFLEGKSLISDFS